MNPYDFVKTINNKSLDLMKDKQAERHYVPFITNRFYSLFPETLVYAQILNQYHTIDNKLQYHFLLNTVRRGNRFSKQTKNEVDGDIEVVKLYYGYNNEKAYQALQLLTKKQLEQLRLKVQQGGINGNHRNTSGSQITE
jgi:hypothetical protein